MTPPLPLYQHSKRDHSDPICGRSFQSPSMTVPPIENFKEILRMQFHTNGGEILKKLGILAYFHRNLRNFEEKKS